MAEVILRLAPALRFEECDDGRCKIVQHSGHAYLFAGAQRALFESLWRGISDADLARISRADPDAVANTHGGGERGPGRAGQGCGALDGWLLSMSELGLVETAAIRRDSDIPWAKAAATNASFSAWPHTCLALWGLALAGLCADAILRQAFEHSLPRLSFVHLVAAAMAWCTWVVMHEAAHWFAARWHGVTGSIEFFRHGRLAPRFHAAAVRELACARVRYWIYIAGPLFDVAVALLLLTATRIQSEVWFGWASVVASVFAAFSLIPLEEGDTRKAWACVQPGCRHGVFVLLYCAIACFCLAMTSAVCIQMLFRIAPVHGWHSLA